MSLVQNLTAFFLMSWTTASPCVSFRPAKHAFLQRCSSAALSADIRIKWIQHSCLSKTLEQRGNLIYSVLESPRDLSVFAVASSGQVDLFPSAWPRVNNQNPPHLCKYTPLKIWPSAPPKSQVQLFLCRLLFKKTGVKRRVRSSQ